MTLWKFDNGKFEMQIENTNKRTPEYCAWSNMKTRCHNRKCEQYKDYGGRGIKICDRWNSFENFLADMGLKPSSELSIDRINNNGDYCPENCRWTTAKIQNNNKRFSKNQKWFMAHNKKFNMVRYSNNQTLFAREYNLSYSSINNCLNNSIRYKSHKGWTFKYLNQPV